MKNTIFTAIMLNAKAHVAINAKNSGLDKDTVSSWKNGVNTLYVAMARYSTALAVTNTTADRSALREARLNAYNALVGVKALAGFTFPNGNNDIELLDERLVSTKAFKDDDGDFVTAGTVYKSEQTARREIEYWLYQREMGEIGVTAEEYRLLKVAQKARRDAMRKAKGTFAKWAKALENPLDDEQIKTVWENSVDEEKEPDEIVEKAKAMAEKLFGKKVEEAA